MCADLVTIALFLKEVDSGDVSERFSRKCAKADGHRFGAAFSLKFAEKTFTQCSKTNLDESDTLKVVSIGLNHLVFAHLVFPMDLLSTLVTGHLRGDIFVVQVCNIPYVIA
jgi:hypothetical protein